MTTKPIVKNAKVEVIIKVGDHYTYGKVIGESSRSVSGELSIDDMRQQVRRLVEEGQRDVLDAIDRTEERLVAAEEE